MSPPVPSPDRALTASTRARYTVYREGQSTGRSFTSLPAAQRYARSVGGNVVTDD